MKVDCPTLEDWQLEDAEFVAQHGRVFLGHATGLGKTLIAMKGWELLDQKYGIKRVLILTSKSGLTAWIKQLPKWGDTNAMYIRHTTPRKEEIWYHAMRSKDPAVWLMTQHLFRQMSQNPKLYPLLSYTWDLVIDDEAHRNVRNKKTQAYKAFEPLARRTRFLIMMSATWASRGPQDLWAGLHAINPKYFSSYWRFVSTFCYVEVNEFGGRQIMGPRNVPALRELLSKCFRKRTWEEVEPSLPPVRREVIELPLAEAQQKLYDKLDSEMYLELERDGVDVVASTSLAKITRLRQIAVSPLLVGSSEPGAYIEDLLERLDEDPHVVVFTLYTSLIEPLRQILNAAGHENVFHLQGGTEPEEVASRIDAFKASRGIMLCSVLFAESFALDTVRNAYVLGFSWDPEANRQMEGRLRRLDTTDKHAVMVHYYLAEGTIEYHAREVVNGKSMNTHAVLRSVYSERKATTETG